MLLKTYKKIKTLKRKTNLKLRNKIKKLPFIGNLFIRFYFFMKPERKLGYWIKRYISSKKGFLVQIGANDGKTFDPIYRSLVKNTNWEALLVEPVPYIFNQLKQNYPSHSRFRFENVAINDGTSQVFYSIRREAEDNIENLPYWYYQLGSFEKENILKHFDGLLEPYLEPIMLKGLTLKDLFLKHNLGYFDLLNIDTEGYDWKILSQLDLVKHSPTLIIYEHKHLSDRERAQSLRFLEKNYHVFKCCFINIYTKKDS